MNDQNQYLSDISAIKNMMERSSRFISLSGLSGIFAGTYALIGAGLVFNKMYALNESGYYRVYDGSYPEDLMYMVFIALAVLVLAIGTGIYFTTKQAKKHNLKIWDVASKRLIINLLIPLSAGGIICLMLIKGHYWGLVAPATLIFYGLSLVNASHFTLRDIRYLGISEILLGLIACFNMGYGLMFWAVGFGVLHIIYGALMYFKYER